MMPLTLSRGFRGFAAIVLLATAILCAVGLMTRQSLFTRLGGVVLFTPIEVFLGGILISTVKQARGSARPWQAIAVFVVIMLALIGGIVALQIKIMAPYLFA